MLPEGTRLIRTMPNTPALVHCGATALSPGPHATQIDEDLVYKLFSSIGICEKFPENLLDSITGLSGGGPAYVSISFVLHEYTHDCLNSFQTEPEISRAIYFDGTGRSPR